MLHQFADLVRLAGITILVTFLWAASVAFTYWDLRRSSHSGSQAWLWIALVFFLPLVGFLLYIFSRAVGLTDRLSGSAPGSKAGRVTPLKYPPGERNLMPTLHVSSLGKQTVIETGKVILPGAAARTSGAKYVLTVSSGAELGKQYPIDKLPARIGRGSQATIPLDHDLGVSRQHAELYARHGELRLRDLQSTHGTRVNGLPVEDQMLVSGDRIQVGQTTLVVCAIRE